MAEGIHSRTPSAYANRPRWRRRFAWLTAAITVVGVCIWIRQHWDADEARAQVQAPRQTRKAPRASSKKPAKRPAQGQTTENRRKRIPDPVAVVNGEDIRRADLERASVQRHGEEILEGMVNKHLVLHHCRKRGITVTAAEVDAEIDRIAKRFNLSRDQYLNLLQKERGVNLDEYRRDTVWAMLALRKLAADQLTVSREELQQAYETQYGRQVRARLIVVKNAQLAKQLHSQLVANPKDFARLAIDHSADVNSASIGGLIQPIRRYVGDPAIEKAVFALQPNQISPIIRVGNQFAILKCEGHIPARRTPVADVQHDLVEKIKEEKLRTVANDLFDRLQKPATVKNVYNDPTLRQTMPGVVATVNGDPITLRQLGEECIQRHGDAVLQVEISHLLLKQALQSARVTVSDEDLNGEIYHAAKLAGIVDKAGQPDIKKWMEMATTERGISREMYFRDSVWPSAALKKLTGGDVEVNNGDLQKGFEANYGERVRCRAIVMPDHRKAQQVWDMARKNPTVENFAQLASEYSIEPTSSSLAGEVPPIRRHGGQPQIEEAAFALRPGQVSGILHVADKAVILFCEGRTQPVAVKPTEVRDILYRDIFEKKLRQAMAQRFEKMQANARIENYLAGTSQAPPRKQASRTAKKNGRAPRRDNAVQPASRQR